ncbi:SERAC1-like [Lucilia cuprina]|nr:SERAC1-like [Lucilia cuprina]
METKKLTNDTIIKNNYDSIISDTNFNPTTTATMGFNDENSNSSCGTTITMSAIAKTMASTIASRDEQNNSTTTERSPLQKAESFGCDSSLMSCCSEDEETDNGEDIENAFENESDRENEIFYDSTNESEDYDGEPANKKRTENEEIPNYSEEDCGLSKLKENKSMRVAFGVILRLIFPLANGVVQGIKGIRDVRFLKVIRSIASSRQALTNLFAFAANTISLNLSSVQVSHRIEPILKLLKIRKSRDGIESLPDSPTLPNGPDALTPPSSPNSTAPLFSPFSPEPRYSLPNFPNNGKKLSIEEYVATKCCTLNILAEPPAGEPIRADIVFIHGLHGSLVNTWKQGLWENERRPVEFQRPPKPPVRPPKRPRHSRTSAVHPPHHKKRARFAHADVHHRHSHERDSIDEADDNKFPYNYLYYFLSSRPAFPIYAANPKIFKYAMVSNTVFPPSVCVCMTMVASYKLNMIPNVKMTINVLVKSNDKDSTKNNNNNNTNDNKEQTRKGKSSKPSPNDPNYSRCWPGDWLPIDCPGVRVIALNYTTDQHLWRPLWKKKEPRSNLIQRAREMTELLIKQRVGYGHPIIWVGHSKGGLFIKQIIVDAWESGRPAAAPFWRSARGVFFYSVPHRGSHLASIKAPLLLRSVELIDIEKNNKYLVDLHRRFAGLYHLGHLKIEVFSFVETALTLMSVLYMRIVGVDSADPGFGDVCGIRLDHREICKPRSRDCILYKQLVNMINKVC